MWPFIMNQAAESLCPQKMGEYPKGGDATRHRRAIQPWPGAPEDKSVPPADTMMHCWLASLMELSGVLDGDPGMSPWGSWVILGEPHQPL